MRRAPKSCLSTDPKHLEGEDGEQSEIVGRARERGRATAQRVISDELVTWKGPSSWRIV